MHMCKTVLFLLPTSGLKSDINIEFLDPNFLQHRNFGNSVVNYRLYCIFSIGMREPALFLLQV